MEKYNASETLTTDDIKDIIEYVDYIILGTTYLYSHMGNKINKENISDLPDDTYYYVSSIGYNKSTLDKEVQIDGFGNKYLRIYKLSYVDNVKPTKPVNYKSNKKISLKKLGVI